MGMAAEDVDELLVIGGLDVDRDVEAKLVNIEEGDMRRSNDPDKANRIMTVEAVKEKEKEIMAMTPQQEDINKPELNIRFRIFPFQKVLHQASH